LWEYHANLRFPFANRPKVVLYFNEIFLMLML